MNDGRSNSGEPRETSRTDSVRLASQLPPEAVPIEVTGTDGYSPELIGNFKKTARRAVDFFSEHFGSTGQTLKISIGTDETAFRTGYNLTTGKVRYPFRQSLKNDGLESKDVLTHEIFHALVSQKYPHLSGPSILKKPEMVRMHEALADFFTHQLYPDSHFGEDFEKKRPYLREYSSTRRVSLSPGEHAQANAVSSYLIKNEIRLPQIKEYLDRGDLSLDALGKLSSGLAKDIAKDQTFHMESVVQNYPQSRLRRYRVKPDRALKVEFQPNDAMRREHPDLEVVWRNSRGMPSQFFTVASTETGFEVTPKTESGAEKMIACFHDGDDLIGSRPFYFSVAKPD